MVSGYELLLFLHIISAVVWVGGGVALQAMAIRATRSGDPARMAGFAKDAEWIGMRIFMPASILVIAFGFALVGKGSWGYPFWVAFALGAQGASALVGAAFLGPESGRIGKLVDARGVEHAEVQARIRRIFLVSRVELVILIAVVFDMAIKPAF